MALCLSVGCAAGNEGSTGVTPVGGDGTSDGSGGDGGGGDGGGGDGSEGDGSGDGSPEVGPACQYEDPGADCAYKDPSLPDGVAQDFDGEASSSNAPQLVYPLAESMHAPNLGKISFQFSRGSASYATFRIEVSADDKKYRFYVPCDDDECIVAMPRAEWLTMGADFAGKTLSVTVAGSDGSGGVSVSDPTTIYFSPEGVFGALYYWAAQADVIKRADLGSDTATAFIKPNSDTNKYACVGCHSVSRDGTVIAFAVAPKLESPFEGSVISAIQTAPTADPASPFVEPVNGTSPFAGGSEAPAGAKGPTDHLGHNVALSADGKYAAVNGVPPDGESWPPWFEIRDTKTGSSYGKWSLGDSLFGAEKLPIFPEWSPDGKSIVVALAEEAGEDCFYTAESCRSSIAILPVNGTTISAPKVLVNASADEFHFYPTWSPDGKWVAFASGKRRLKDDGKYETSQSNDNALLRLVRATGGPYNCPSSDCIELTRGTGYSPADAQAKRGKHSTWPKFTPFAQKGGDLMFISFNTHLDYGFLKPVEGDDGERLSQIWMFAVDVSKVGSGDPSYAPVWLPQQDPADGSLAPYWSERLPCSKDPEGGCQGCVGTEQCIVEAATGECSCVVVVM